ncbi:MAG: PH domain-containing protein [Phycisphaerales bacterium]|nr:PH domain-containing protein [Phycisphaerales bacterium]
MSESSRRYAVLREATFDPKLPTYYLLSGMIPFIILIVTIPIAILYYLIGRVLIEKYIDRLSCTLTERTLEIRKGLINRVESTVPLEKITDLQMIQGPIMRYMGLHGFKVETAGQSSGPTGHLISMVGIVDAKGFREAVLDQRDALSEGRVRSPQAEAAPVGDSVAVEGVVEVLTDIRASLHRLEKAVESRADG